MKICPKCNSEKIIPKALVLNNGDNNLFNPFRVAVDENPNALIFKNRHTRTIYAKVCGDCGYIEFFAHEPTELYTVYLRSIEP